MLPGIIADGVSSPTLMSNQSGELSEVMPVSRSGERAQGPTRKPRFLAVDFFCGAGGTTRGLIDAGGYVIAGIDKDPRCRKTFEENNINETIDRAVPRYLGLDVFPRSPSYPHGQQRKLFQALDFWLHHYRRKARNTPLLFAICAPCQ